MAKTEEKVVVPDTLPVTRDTLPVTRVPSDDCAIDIEGVSYYTHRGQWVDVIRGSLSIAELKMTMERTHLIVQVEALRSDMAEAKKAKDDKRFTAVYEERNALMVKNFDEVAQHVADHVADWSWTGNTGKPLAKPDGTIGPIQRLSPDEVYYLQAVSRGEGMAPAEAKNGSSA